MFTGVDSVFNKRSSAYVVLPIGEDGLILLQKLQLVFAAFRSAHSADCPSFCELRLHLLSAWMFPVSILSARLFRHAPAFPAPCLSSSPVFGHQH